MKTTYKELVKKIIPVHQHELTRFLCIATLMFFISYIHSILHISKDALVIQHLGTESISAIKVWVVLPISLIFMFIYIKLADKFTRSQLFHFTNWFLVSYFILFALVLYPHKEACTIDISETLIQRLPSLKYLFKVISNWHYTLFYVFSESWVAIMFTISFWQTANHITTFEESKRFYPLFGFAAGLSKLAAGVLSVNYVAKGMNYQPTLNNVTISIAAAGIGISICIFALEIIIGKNSFNSNKSHFKIKSKITLKESLKYIASSKVILLIVSLLLCYNISINLVEGVWKKSIEVLYGCQANMIHRFISNVEIYISIISMLGSFVCIYILQFFKWRTSALITPVVVFIAGGMFFLFMILRDIPYLVAIPISATAIAVYIGAIYEIFSRSAKHALFDPTKESVYIPLDDDLKTKGKAAAETIGLRFGKGGGAFIQQILFGIFPSLTLLDLSPIIFGIFLIVMLGWFYSTISLDRFLRK
jgi:ATP:ADP antiporter, AAA family